MNKKTITTYEPRVNKLCNPMEGGITHTAKMFLVVNVDGKNKQIEPFGEVWGKSNTDAEQKCFDQLRKWAKNNGYLYKHEIEK